MGISRLLFVGQIALVAAVLGVWLGIDSVRESRSLWVLFAYCLPSEFLVAALPHEPVLLLFAQFHPAWVVALVSAAGTVLTEALNYSVFEYVVDSKLGVRVGRGTLLRRLVAWFEKAPFAALCVAGLTPVPFYPFRFLVVYARYPVWRYLAAVLVSRTPRFWLIALIGQEFPVSDSLLIGLFAALVIGAYAPVAWRKLRTPKVDGQPDKAPIAAELPGDRR